MAGSAGRVSLVGRCKGVEGLLGDVVSGARAQSMAAATARQALAPLHGDVVCHVARSAAVGTLLKAVVSGAHEQSKSKGRHAKNLAILKEVEETVAAAEARDQHYMCWLIPDVRVADSTMQVH